MALLKSIEAESAYLAMVLANHKPIPKIDHRYDGHVVTYHFVPGSKSAV